MKNNGVVVPVKAKLLDVGETTATFEFVTALTADPAGTWTVNNVSFDANAQAAVAKVNAATNQVQLLAALKSTYFVNVDEAKIAAYFGEMSGKTYDTVASVQEAIDKINNAAGEQAVIDAIVDAMTNNNEVALLAQLNKPNFKRVNSDFITQYMAEFKGNVNTATTITAASTAVNVQAEIDAVNLKATQDAVTAADTTPATALTADAIGKAQALVTALPTDTNAEKATKEGLQGKIDVANAVVKVKAATTQASLLSALKSPVLKLQKIDDALAKYYKDKLVPANITTASYDIQTNIIDADKTAAIADYVSKVGAVTAETNTAELKAVLTELKRLDGTNFTETISDSLLKDYRTAIVAAAAGDKDSVGEINTLIQGKNSPTSALTVVVDAGGALDTADKLLAALQAKTLNLTTLVAANKDAYYTDKALLQTAAGTDAAALAKAVNVINAVVSANEASTATGLRTALTNHSANLATPNTAYLDLSAQAKLEVAEIIMEAKTAAFANSAAVTTAVGANAGAGALKVHADILTAVNGEDADSSY
ncbi:hypothetical protein [Brevibacillus sp. AY1]|uniref:hypothetical protein n=1 Tax=Brevibacillus sp. AY1 TaxID=2807621 RepID=UPI0024582E69|nr:hypothetical protein [Brevibacillus sp. AY1]MDH4619987.1 hypothetical protein [Brevibacillus sp. AY1]